MRRHTILVSGGSKGLGLEITRHLLETGQLVGAFARKRSDGIAELEERFAQELEFAEIDAMNMDEVDTFVAHVQARYGGLHGLVNNAAVGQDSLLVHTSPEAIQEILTTNLLAPILLTRRVVKEMLLQGTGGRIVSISSICGLRGYSGLTVYSASKAALSGFTRALAREVGGRNILVNSIAPGFFESEMSSMLNREQMETIQRRTPTQRLTLPMNLLPVLDMLLFSETNLTGQVIIVDGGTSC